MMTSHKHRQSLEEVLDEFFFAADTPSAAAVLRACEAYPQYREDILEFAALWTAHDTAPEPAAADLRVPEASISRLQSYALNSLDEAARAPESASNVDAAKVALAALAGGALRRAAAACGLGTATLLLQKILTNSILDTPQAVIKGLASHLKVTMAGLEIALCGGMAMGRRYSASKKPDAPSQETWQHAVHDLTGVSETEKARLLALADGELRP